MMKYKNIINSLLAAVAIFMITSVTACNDNIDVENVEQVPIQFISTIAGDNWGEESRVTTDATDKVSIIGFTCGDEILVDAWLLNKTLSENAGNKKPDFLYLEPYSFDGLSWLADNQHIKRYWPIESRYQLAFSAYYLAGANSYTISQTYSDNDTDADNEYKYPTITFDTRTSGGNWTSDILAAPITTVSRDQLVDGKATLTFYHIMAKLNMMIKFVAEDPTMQSLQIKKISIHGVPLYGQFKGFDNSIIPIWENVTVYQEDMASKSLSLPLESFSVPNDGAFYSVPGFTCMSYPWTVGYEKTGVVDTKIQVTYVGRDGTDKDFVAEIPGVEFKAGYNNIIYVTMTSTGIQIDVASNLQWSGDGSDIGVTF